jgi:phospholipid/cholesterol/gamma-HCH transport system substrate-binding protein
MKRSTGITWTQLKVGTLLLIAIGILIIAIVKLGEAANLFTTRYELVTFLSNANGLREGGSVTVAGQFAGVVKRIALLPPGGDTTRNLEVTMELDADLREQVRGDSHVELKTLGLLGDKILDITPGTPRYPALDPGDTVPSVPALDYEAVIRQASSAVTDLVQLTRDLRAITGSIARGEGTMGQLLTNPSLYDRLAATLGRVDTLLARVQRPTGTLGRLMTDPALYDHLVRVTAELDTVLGAMHSRRGTMGRLLSDDTLYTRLVGVTAAADSFLKVLTNGDGFASRLLTDQELYDKLNKTLTDLNAILEDLRANPRKYTRGMIRIF